MTLFIIFLKKVNLNYIFYFIYIYIYMYTSQASGSWTCPLTLYYELDLFINQASKVGLSLASLLK